MPKMKFFSEIVEDVSVIEEDFNGMKYTYITGPFLVAGTKNRNNRIYPIDVMEPEVSRYIKESVTPKRAFGELGHPSTPSINLDRVSHLITEIKRDGNVFLGKAKILDTPNGNIARVLAKEGCVGVSSRAVATLEEQNGVHIVQNDFKIATAADIVADPSAPDAFVKVIMEGIDFVYETGDKNLIKVVENTKSQINSAIYSRELADKRKSILLEFVEKLGRTMV